MKLDTFEVLVGDMDGLRWVPFSGRLNVQALGYTPVEGGMENDGTPLYIVKAPFNGFTHPGKTSEKLDGTTVFCVTACDTNRKSVSLQVLIFHTMELRSASR
jgi:Protein of unknown function (DUF3421)